MNILIFILAFAVSALAFALYEAYRDIATLRTYLRRAEDKLAESEAYRDEVKRSAMRGAPLVRWHRDLAAGLPLGADMWYWRIRTADGDLLITDEALKVARERAENLLPKP